MALPIEFGLLHVQSYAFVVVPLSASIERDISHWLGIPLALVIVAIIALRRWGKQRMAQRKGAKDRSSLVSLNPRPMTVHRRGHWS
jgi:hypothetical protein